MLESLTAARTALLVLDRSLTVVAESRFGFFRHCPCATLRLASLDGVSAFLVSSRALLAFGSTISMRDVSGIHKVLLTESSKHRTPASIPKGAEQFQKRS